MSEVKRKAKLAKEISKTFFPTTEMKNRLLVRMGEILLEQKAAILEANQLDLKKGEEEGISKALLDRLALNDVRIEAMAEGLRQISQLPDPVGEIVETITRPNGLKIEKQRVPLGVIGIIYEARPNVTVDAAGLCLKTGNAVILRGGSAAVHSNTALIKLLHQAMEELDFPTDFLHLIEDTDRTSVDELLQCKEYVDVIIPRGGRSLIQRVVEHSLVPVIETGEGICHIYVHHEADPKMAEAIVLNAKCQRPSVCNAVETILMDKSFAKKHLESMAVKLKEQGVELRGCDQARELVPWLGAATEEDWSTEYLDFILAIKLVENDEEAIKHINQYGTGHSEAIVTQSEEAKAKFMEQVDAACVYHNASTRFTDGFEFGFGAEIGISTQKLHARGPMGLKELTSYKYLVFGEGQTRG